MLRLRYTAWDGTQQVRLSADQVFEKLSEYLSFTDDVQQALDWLLHQGLEWDGMRVMGLEPMEALVVPRVVAMLVMTPILTFAAIMAGIVGGMIVAWGALGVSPLMFFTRISENVPSQHFWVGMSKSPAFAIAIAIVGCKQGLSVGDDVGSLGKRVTSSVVQAIFLVILMDALFALWFLELNI